MKINFLDIIENQLKYKITIGKETFDYSTGLGWLSLKKQDGTTRLDISNLDLETKIQVVKSVLGFYKNLSVYDLENTDIVYRKNPIASEILEFLYSDRDCGSYSFYEFCDNLGYDRDSIKALDTYRACMENAEKVNRLERQGFISRVESPDGDFVYNLGNGK